MRRLLAVILALMLCSGLCAAEEPQRIETSLFTLELPAGLNPNLDEYSRTDYSFLSHILRPIIIQGENDRYMLLITLYDFPSEARHRIDAQSDRAQGLFTLMCEYNGLNCTGTARRAEGDFRDFIIGSDAAQGRCMATWYNQSRGEGLVFELRMKDGALSVSEAEALLLEVAASLREAGVVYPEATGQTLLVTHAGVNVRTEPDAGSTILCVAREGETFPFLGENGIWYMIDVDGQIGYVSKALTQVQE